jgi:hypothetical protein
MATGCTLYWNGENFPEELRALPAGRYVVEPVDHVPLLSDDDEAGLNAALDSLQAGKGRSLAQVQETIAAKLAAAEAPGPPRSEAE